MTIDPKKAVVGQPAAHEFYTSLYPVSNLTFKHNGKFYEITFVKQKIGDNEQTLEGSELAALSESERDKLIAEARKSMEMMDKLPGANVLNNSKSFTFNFTAEINPSFINNTLGKIFERYFSTEKNPSFINKKLGKIFERFAYKPNYQFSSISYYEGTEMKTFSVNLAQYIRDDAEKIITETQPLNKHIEELFMAKAKKDQEATPLTLNDPDLAEDLTDAPSVQQPTNNLNLSDDAGSLRINPRPVPLSSEQQLHAEIDDLLVELNRPGK